MNDFCKGCFYYAAATDNLNCHHEVLVTGQPLGPHRRFPIFTAMAIETSLKTVAKCKLLGFKLGDISHA